jgi:hypothetical protein
MFSTHKPAFLDWPLDVLVTVCRSSIWSTSHERKDILHPPSRPAKVLLIASGGRDLPKIVVGFNDEDDIRGRNVESKCNKMARNRNGTRALAVATCGCITNRR